MQVRKRNGDIKDFDENKIEKVIIKASRTAKENVDVDTISKIVKYVTKEVAKLEEPIDVRDIRKSVENALMKYNLFDTARVYIEECRKREATYLQGLPIWEEMDIKLSGRRNDRQNANVDEETFGGRMGEAMDAMLKEKALGFMINPKFAKLMRECKNYIHDCNRWSVGMHNCLSFPIDNITAKPATIKVPNALRVPGDISTFCQIILVHLQSQSQDQFGGVSITHFDWSSIPFIRKTYWKIFRDLLDVYNALMGTSIPMPCTKEECTGISITDEMYTKRDSRLAALAFEKTKKQTHQACEGLLHNANTLQSRSGNQLPFTSINYGTCTLPEGQMACEALLQAWEEGIGEFGLTPIFPCGIFQLKEGINTKKGEPNYYLFRKALEVLPKRDYPNFANADWSVDMAGFKKSQHIKQNVLEGLDKETWWKVAKLPKAIQNTLGFQIKENGELSMNTDPQPFEMMSTMGCLSGTEHLYIKVDGKVYDVSIKDFFEYAQTGVLKNARPAEVFFNKARTELVGDKHIQDKSGIKPGSGVYAITYKPSDVTYIGSSSDVCRRWAEHKCNIKLTGGLDAGPCFGDNNPDNYEFKVLEYTPFYKEAEKHYIENNVTINFKGTDNRYYKDARATKILTERPNWQLAPGGQTLVNLEDKDIHIYDINNNWVKVRHVFRNDKMSSPYMMHIYYDENGKKHCISATEDHPFFNGKDFTKACDLRIGDILYRADGLEMVITNIGYHWEPVESFDIGTESGTFVGSDIKMHNCRTYNGFDINFTEDYFLNKVLLPTLETGSLPLDQLWSGNQKDGRGNVAPNTVVMPMYAMEAKKKAEKEGHPEYAVDYFMDALETAIGNAKDELIDRFNWIAAQPSSVSKYMYEWNHTMLGWDASEGIRSCLKHGTLAIGQIGLSEVLYILIGKNQTTEEGMVLAERIERLFNTKCSEYKEHYKLNFGVYFTPAEGLSYTSYKAFKKKYKDVENVTYWVDEEGNRHDKEYITNSIHVPVYQDIMIIDKFRTEARLAKYSNAGCITYGEIDGEIRWNIDALEQIILAGKRMDLPYIALNFQINECTKCGNTDIDTETKTCRRCKATEEFINWLRRVTGYLTGNFLRAFNLGKQCETKQRVKHATEFKNIKFS